MTARVVLIDGSSLIFRAYFAIPSSFTTANGLHTNATYGFALMFRKILTGKMPEFAAVVFDAPGKTFRDDRYPEYKSHRPKMDGDLVEQLPWIDKVVEVHDFPVLRVPGVEADDVIGTLTRQALEAGYEVQILSADKDFAQLIDDRVRMVDTMRDITYDAELVRKKWGVRPDQMRDYLAIVGDKSDNVPGVPGVGQKTVKELLSEYGDLQTILQRRDELTGRAKGIAKHAELALLSQELVTIDQHLNLDVSLDDLRVSAPDPAPINNLYRELEFNSLLADEDRDGIEGIDTDKFERVQSLDEIDEVITQLLDKTAAIIVLCEPPGYVMGDIVGVALATGKGRAWYIPMFAPRGGLGLAALRRLAPYLEDPDQQKVVHDLRDVLCLLRRDDIELRGVQTDVQLASFLIDPTKNIPHTMSQVTKEFLQRTLKPLKDLVGSGKSQQKISDCDADDTAAWACHVAVALAEMRQPVIDKLRDEGREHLLHDVEIPLSYTLADMQLAGVRVDPGELRAMEIEFTQRRDAIASQIFEAAGGEFNLNSPKQLGEVLFDKLELPVIKRTKTGYSTAADVLERLAADHEIPRLVLRWRTLEKLINTYTRVLVDSRDPGTGRIHATFQQTTGSSGRLITTNPDLQRTPIRGEDGSRIRRAFIPRDGWVFISADWSQIELRMLAHFCKDPALLESFREDIDLHRRTASMLFDVPPDEVSSRQRDMGKTVNFATIYGQGATALGQQLGIKRSEAKGLIDRYFDGYSGVRRWLDDTIAQAHEVGFVETLIGRRRYIPELKSNNFSDRGYGERVAANTPIQGSAADLCKLTMLDIGRQIETRGLELTMMVQIHDELLFECPPHEVEDAVALIRDRMEHTVKLEVPLKVDIGTGASWAEAH